MRLAVIFLFLIGAAALGIGLTLLSFNQFGAVTREVAGRCAPVAGVAGPEDMAVDRARGLVFVSSLDRRDPEARGAIHIFDPADPLAAQGWRDMSNGAPEDFEPLGLDYYEEDGVRRLFVVNDANDAVEIFDVAEDGALTHLDTVTERRLTSPNGVAAVGLDRFYVTNDLKAGRDSIVGSIQFLLRSREGEVLHFDGDDWRVAASDLRFANGVALSADGAGLFVAETAGKAIRVYERDPASGALSESRRIVTPAFPDNLTVDGNGTLWAAGLPKPLTLPGHASRRERLAPSEVMRIDEAGPVTVYRDDGSELSAASVAALVGEKLLIGAIFEEKFLLCDLPDAAF